MIEPQMPKHPANYSEKSEAEWMKYWVDIQDWNRYASVQKEKAYRKAYYANKTRLRQIGKMKELMTKYPDEAKEFYDKSN